MRVEVESTPLRDRIADAVYDAILHDAVAALRAHETAAGTAEIPIGGHLVRCRAGDFGPAAPHR